MNNKKLIALDMDGTVLNDAGILTGEVIETIDSARRNNCIVCFVTGRRDIDIAPVYQQCKHVDYLIMNNGARIIDIRQEKVVLNRLMDSEAVKNLVIHCLNNNILMYVTAGLFWAVNIMTDGVRSYAKGLGREPSIYHSYKDLPLDRIDGLMVTNKGASVSEYIQEHNMPLYCLQSEPNCIDIIPEGAGKWEAISMLSQELNVEHRNVIAVGNYNNDIDMITKAGIGIAVSNALQEVKASADYITALDNNHNFLQEILNKFIFI